ncbi:radical SAM protein [Corallococcus exercitus]|uniref:radical SAM protein n=1 Tax=Corallococcus exercitus TaxID=2316736 RepID=UPI000EA04201|nr:radical SAM protein [Corallococcus exercitus]RKG82743.1 radical SAM protein [Corallococcus exercitus]
MPVGQKHGSVAAPAPIITLPLLEDSLALFKQAQPETVTILPTYRCNAACAECCFESNPSIKHRMTRADLLRLVERVRTELPGVKYVVLSGGEVTLLREDLIAVIARLSELGLGSRIVSNGHWGRTDESAAWWVENLMTAGLSELNLSTGDDHVQFVPLDSVARAASHAARRGLTTLVVVEGKDDARLKVTDITGHPLVAECWATPEHRDRLLVMTNIWMPFHDESDIKNEKVAPDRKGCDNVFENFVVNPYGHLLSCCGLTMEYIPEMKIGQVESLNLREAYTGQFRDLLKLWIWLDGTPYVLEQASERAGISLELVSPHQCSICAQLYQNDKLRAAARDLVLENAEQLLLRAMIKARLMGRIPDSVAPPHSKDVSRSME